MLLIEQVYCYNWILENNQTSISDSKTGLCFIIALSAGFIMILSALSIMPYGFGIQLSVHLPSEKGKYHTMSERQNTTRMC